MTPRSRDVGGFAFAIQHPTDDHLFWFYMDRSWVILHHASRWPTRPRALQAVDSAASGVPRNARVVRVPAAEVIDRRLIALEDGETDLGYVVKLSSAEGRPPRWLIASGGPEGPWEPGAWKPTPFLDRATRFESWEMGNEARKAIVNRVDTFVLPMADQLGENPHFALRVALTVGVKKEDVQRIRDNLKIILGDADE